MKANHLSATIIIFLGLAALPVQGQFIKFTVFAGQTNAIGTNDGNGTAAQFNHPRGLATDPAGNVFVADSYNGSIRRITPDGTVTTLTFQTLPPNQPALPANIITPSPTSYVPFHFSAPESILVDGNTNLYISDNNIIYKAQLTTNTNGSNVGEYTLALVAGHTNALVPINGDAGLHFNHVSGMALDGNSNLFFTDQYNQVVRKVSPSRAVSIVAGKFGVPGYSNGTGTNARIYFPYCVAAGVSNTLYVTDGIFGVRQITQSNVIGNFWGLNDYAPAHAITSDAAGNVYVASPHAGGANTVLQITPAGASNVLGSMPGSGTISAIAVDGNTNIYLADQQNSVIYKIAPFPAFFNGQVFVGGNLDYLAFTNGTPFGYYILVSYDFPLFYHVDLGFEKFMDANDGQAGAYLYDFASSTWWYTSPQVFPWLYDFSLNTWLYYYPDPRLPGRYYNYPRSFYDFATGTVINK